MSKPATLATWATDTNIASGTESGTPTKVAPSAGYIAQGLVPGLPFVGPYANWLLNNLCAWAAYLNGLPTDNDFRNANFTWGGSHSFDQANVSYAAGATGSFVVPVTTGTPKVAGDSYTTSGGEVNIITPATYWDVPLRLPQGATITGLETQFLQALSHSSIAAYVAIIRIAPAFAAVSATSATLADVCRVTQTGAGWRKDNNTTVANNVVDNSLYEYVFRFGTSDSTTGGNPDVLYSARVNFSIPAPKVW